MFAVHRTDPYRLFLAEDNPAEVRLIKEAIKEAALQDDVELDYGFDGEEVCEKLETAKVIGKNYDLVLLDLNMPRISGREVLQKIKTDPMLMGIPVIVVTNSDYKKDMIDCYRLGADGYFQKPADFKKLVDFFISVRESIRVRNKMSVFYIEKTYDELALAS